MSYLQTKPDSGPSPKLDAPIIQGNFSSFASIFSSTVLGVVLNHIAMNDPNQGDHGAIILEKQSADPGADQPVANLYNKNAAAATGGPQPQLFSQIQKFLPTKLDTTDAANVGVQLTYNTVNLAGPIYQSFVAGGYIVYFGATSVINSAITLSPTPSSLLVVMAQPSVGVPQSVKYGTQILSATQFKINASAAVGAYTYFAIGVA